MMPRITFSGVYGVFVVLILNACAGKPEAPEQLRVPNSVATDSVLNNAIDGTLSPEQVLTTPHRVVLTGVNNQRLITIYKQGFEKRVSTYDSYSDYDPWYSDHQLHFMPGIDLINGYDLLNVAHYDLVAEKLTLLFDKPVLVKSIYYPSFVQDSLQDQPINRNYYLLSAYDQDTNLDSLIDNRDLRRFYYYPLSGVQPLQLIPGDYSVMRSQYDSGNDVMYIFACHDRNADGHAESNEPVHVFWLNLKQPTVAKRMY